MTAGGPAPSNSGEPGSSASREYQRRRAQREQHARARLGALGVAISRLSTEPQHVRSWKTGAEGERRVAQRLAKHLAQSDVVLLHDRRIPRSRANIDHLAVGPAGVTVIDAKYLTGEIRIRRYGGVFSERIERLFIGGRDRTKLIEGVERQLDVVRTALDAMGYEGAGLAGALCLADGRGLPWFSRLEMRGVLIEAPRRVAALASREGLLDRDAIQVLAAALANRFPSA